MSEEKPHFRTRLFWIIALPWIVLSPLSAWFLSTQLVGVEGVSEGAARAISSKIWGVAGGLVVVGCAISWWLARRMSRTLESTEAFVQGVARTKKFDNPPRVRERELAGILQAVERLARSIAKRDRKRERGRQHLETIIESTVEGILALDAKGGLLFINEVARDILRLPLLIERLPDRPPFSQLTAAIETCIVKQHAITRDLELEGAQPLRTLDIQIAPLRDEKRQVFGAVAVLHDVTEKRRIEAMKRDFVANVSHELKTPLTTIMGAADTVADNPTMPEETRTRFLSRIVANSKRLNSLINDLLDLSRVQGEEIQRSDTRHSLRDIVRESIVRFEDKARESDIRLLSLLSEEPLSVAGDDRDLRSVADNLILNALAYTPPGGRVTVRTRRDGQWAVFSVEDTGVGMEPEHLDRIFERFYRVDPARSRHQGGTGLGLSIVKNAVHAHGGEIDVRSRPGEGTIFWVRLPLPTDNDSEASPSPPEPDAAKRGE
ncbi:MAG TPA: hypothetical protein ENK43_01425 [Planctomycetes bacterium]|nr:hypothetical protein [Planctomycetota bacterium]